VVVSCGTRMVLSLCPCLTGCPKMMHQGCFQGRLWLSSLSAMMIDSANCRQLPRTPSQTAAQMIARVSSRASQPAAEYTLLSDQKTENGTPHHSFALVNSRSATVQCRWTADLASSRMSPPASQRWPAATLQHPATRLKDRRASGRLCKKAPICRQWCRRAAGTSTPTTRRTRRQSECDFCVVLDLLSYLLRMAQVWRRAIFCLLPVHDVAARPCWPDPAGATADGSMLSQAHQVPGDKVRSVICAARGACSAFVKRHIVLLRTVGAGFEICVVNASALRHALVGFGAGRCTCASAPSWRAWSALTPAPSGFRMRKRRRWTPRPASCWSRHT